MCPNKGGPCSNCQLVMAQASYHHSDMEVQTELLLQCKISLIQLTPQRSKSLFVHGVGEDAAIHICSNHQHITCMASSQG